MTRRILSSQFFADDKDIEDFLRANKRKVGRRHLQEFLLRRGLLVSASATHERLIEQVAMIPITLSELQTLFALANGGGKGEKLSTRRIVGCSLDKLTEPLSSVKEDLAKRGDVCNVRRTNRAYEVDVVYTELDHRMNRLGQKVEKTLSIRLLSMEGDAVVVSHDNNVKAASILDELVGLIRKQDATADEVPISLSGVTDPKQRTKFFVDLSAGMEDFALQQVLSVRTARLDDAIVSEEDARRGDEILSHVQQVDLKGKHILAAPEFEELGDKGFFVHYMSWRAVRGEDELFELEAGFRKQGRDIFEFKIRACFPKKKSGGYMTVKKPISLDIKNAVTAALESAARAAMRKAAENGD